MNIAIIGAGWAGCAAAWQAHKLGYRATVFEAAPFIGGRARKHSSQALGQIADNGQHILLGAYQSTLALMRELDLEPKQHFHRFDLDISSMKADFCFRTAALPAPWHLLGAPFRSRGVKFSEFLQLQQLQRYLKKQRWQVQPGTTVAELLQQTGQSTRLTQKLWHPLCVAALNTPIEQACAQLFAHVLRDSLGADRSATQMLIPLRNMSDLWPQRALQHARVRTRHPIRAVQRQGQQYLLDGQPFDGVIIATNAPSAYRLLQSLDAEKQKLDFVNQITSLDYNPIATLYLKPEKPWENPHVMRMLDEDLHGLAAGQWVFNHGALNNSELYPLIAVTISYANRLQGHDKTEIARAIIAQINHQSPWPLPTITAFELITEKRATFIAKPHLSRPHPQTPWPNVLLAGDWVHNDYPAVLEGAVRSGIMAAKALQPH